MKSLLFKNLILALVIFYSLTTISAATSVELHLITDPSLPTLSTATIMDRLIHIPSYDVKLISHKYFKDSFPDLKVLPAFYFSPDLAKEEKIFWILTSNSMVVENRNIFDRLMYEVVPETYDPSLYLKETPQAKILELFYRPFCPYGLQALKGLLNLKAQKNSPLKKLILTPIVYEGHNGSADSKDLEESFLMSGGLAEIEETIRQQIIYDKWPNKLSAYLEARQNIRSSYWAGAAKKAGLDVNAITNIAQTRGAFLLGNGVKRTKLFKIKASPTYLWGNQKRYNYTQELLSEPAFKGLKIPSGKESCH